MDEHEKMVYPAKFARFAKMYKVIPTKTRQLFRWRENCYLFFILPSVPTENPAKTADLTKSFIYFTVMV